MPVPDRRKVAKQFAIVEIGPHQPHITKVGAPKVGIIKDIDVPICQIAIFGGLVDHRFHGKGHDADKNGQPRFSLNQSVPGYGMIQPVRRVVCFGDNRVESRAKQGRVHLVCDLLHAARQNG